MCIYQYTRCVRFKKNRGFLRDRTRKKTSFILLLPRCVFFWHILTVPHDDLLLITSSSLASILYLMRIPRNFAGIWAEIYFALQAEEVQQAESSTMVGEERSTHHDPIIPHRCLDQQTDHATFRPTRNVHKICGPLWQFTTVTLRPCDNLLLWHLDLKWTDFS
jgi:hypothetical protein